MQSVGRAQLSIKRQPGQFPFSNADHKYWFLSIALVPKCNCSLNWCRREESHMSIPVALYMNGYKCAVERLVEIFLSASKSQSYVEFPTVWMARKSTYSLFCRSCRFFKLCFTVSTLAPCNVDDPFVHHILSSHTCARRHEFWSNQIY